MYFSFLTPITMEIPEQLLYYPILDVNRPKAQELKQQIES